MNMADLGIAIGIVGGAVGILSPVVGWALLIYRDGRSRGTFESETRAELKATRNENNLDHGYIKDSIDKLSKTIGNGGSYGIKGELHNMQVNCAKEVADIQSRLRHLEK